MRCIVALIAAAAVPACGGARSSVDVAPEVQPSMFRISAQMFGLDRAVSVADPAVRQQGVLRALDNLTDIARELTTPRLRESHAVMDTEVDQFLADILEARAAAAADPPNYYWAGRLHATCVRCHDPEGGVWKK